ncbi:MAG TPA: alkaline phosphatase family protein, partial [Piscinibacter sp.]|nr:alkaline phosphatase family protein [Piscinibacter sp.]
MNVPTLRRAVALAAALALAGCAAPTSQQASQASIERVRHVVVIFAENHSFDNLYGLFPGADGVANATAEQATQLDHDGQPLKELVVFGADGKPDARFPRMPNKPFRIDAPPVSKTIREIVPSPIHAFFHNQEQINGG